jgi:diguanylate cyclase (GGDEF)-like protein
VDARRGARDVRAGDAAECARDSGRPFALLYLDLDGFKAVDDTHGHEAGDASLREVAQRLLRTLRGGDAVFRMGGDGFVAIADGVPDLMAVGPGCERVPAALQAPVQVGARAVTVGASIGTCRYPIDEPMLDGMVRRADDAMLRAKRAGAGRRPIARRRRTRRDASGAALGGARPIRRARRAARRRARRRPVPSRPATGRACGRAASSAPTRSWRSPRARHPPT